MCAAWLLCLVWIGHPENDLLKALWSQTMAAWVQAIGSIGAIVGAVWLAAHDRREQARLQDVAALEVGAVVFEQGYWLARRTVLKLPTEEKRLEAAQASWARVSTQWTATVDHIRRLQPMIPEQFNAQLLTVSRLDRAICLYEGSLGEYLDMAELLDLDKATGRVFRELEFLDEIFAQRGARGPTTMIRHGIANLALQVEAKLMDAGANLIADDSLNFTASETVIADAVIFFERRVEAITRIQPSDNDFKDPLLGAARRVLSYVQSCKADLHHNREDRTGWADLRDHIEGLGAAADDLKVPIDPGG